MQALFLALFSIQAVLIGATYALLITYVQMIAARYTPRIAQIALQSAFVRTCFLLMVGALAALGAGAIVTSTMRPLPDILQWAPGTHAGHGIAIGAGGVGLVFASVAIALVLLTRVSRYVDPKRTGDAIIEDLAAGGSTLLSNGARQIGGARRLGNFLLLVPAEADRPMQTLLELLQVAIRDDDRVLFKALVTKALGRLCTDGASWAAIKVSLIEQVLGLLEDRGPTTLLTDLATAIVVRARGAVSRDAGVVPIDADGAVGLLLSGRQLSYRLLRASTDIDAKDLIGSWWTLGVAVTDISVNATLRAHALNGLATLGALLAETAEAVVVDVGEGTLAPGLTLGAPALREWCEGLDGGLESSGHVAALCIAMFPGLDRIVPSLVRRAVQEPNDACADAGVRILNSVMSRGIVGPSAEVSALAARLRRLSKELLDGYGSGLALAAPGSARASLATALNEGVRRSDALLTRDG